MKSICFLIITVLLLTAAGCGKSGADDTATTTTAPAAGTTAAVVTTTPTTAAPSVGWVVADSMHVRLGPGTDYKVNGGVKYGEQQVILGKEGDWYKIAWNKEPGYGYVSAQYIVFEDPATMTTTAATTTATTSTIATTAAP